MDGFALNGAGHLLALSGGEVQLGSYSPSRDGRLRMRDQVEQADGIGISQPSALEVAELAGRYYAIVAARGSSSLSVIEVAADGTLILRDHLLDSTETRFGTAAHVAVAARGDQVFVAAAGSEPGLSLFQLLPGGRLLHLDTLADHAGITLADISALDMLAQHPITRPGFEAMRLAMTTSFLWPEISPRRPCRCPSIVALWRRK